MGGPRRGPLGTCLAERLARSRSEAEGARARRSLARALSFSRVFAGCGRGQCRPGKVSRSELGSGSAGGRGGRSSGRHHTGESGSWPWPRGSKRAGAGLTATRSSRLDAAAVGREQPVQPSRGMRPGAGATCAGVGLEDCTRRDGQSETGGRGPVVEKWISVLREFLRRG